MITNAMIFFKDGYYYAALEPNHVVTCYKSLVALQNYLAGLGLHEIDSHSGVTWFAK